MGRYDRYILSQLLILFGFFTLVLVAVYWINRAVGLFDTLIADGQSLGVFLEFTALSLPRVIQTVLPVSTFVAAVYVINRMITESEMVVLQTSGLSALRLLRPVATYGLVVAVIVGALAHVLVPAARTQFIERSTQVEEDLGARLLRDGQFLHPAPGVTLYIREITDLGEFRDLFLQDRADPQTEITYTARTALLVRREAGPRLLMFDGMAQTLQVDTRRLSIVEFEDFTYDLGALTEDQSREELNLFEMSTPTLLLGGPDVAQRHATTLAAMRYEGHERIALQLFVLVVPLIGAAALMQGRFSRFGIWPRILLAVLLVVPLEIVRNWLEGAASADTRLSGLVYLQPGLAALFAAGLTLRAMRSARPRRRRRPADPGGAGGPA